MVQHGAAEREHSVNLHGPVLENGFSEPTGSYLRGAPIGGAPASGISAASVAECS
jgi:hypothetical protein